MADAGRINEYFDGMVEGVRLYAHWKDGTQYVGTCGRTLAEAIKDIEVDRARELKKISIT